jgi:hypothetical protein
MIIRCQSVDDFLANLEGVKVYRGTIHVNRTRDPVNGPKHLATSFDVYFQATTILDFEDGQALLECGEMCGTDRETEDGDMEGTARQNELFTLVYDFCVGNGLEIKPGFIDQG